MTRGLENSGIFRINPASGVPTSYNGTNNTQSMKAVLGAICGIFFLTILVISQPAFAQYGGSYPTPSTTPSTPSTTPSTPSASTTGQTTTEVDIAKGAGLSSSAACVATKNCFAPNPLTVSTGTEVDWKNTDTVPHTATSDKLKGDNTTPIFDSGVIQPGADFKFTLADAGTYNYHCTIHPWLTGQVMVVAGAQTGNAIPEFGSLASLVLAIAILSIVVFAAKTKVIQRL